MAHVALVIALLGRTDLFRSLSEADRAAVAAQMREATYELGSAYLRPRRCGRGFVPCRGRPSAAFRAVGRG